MSETTNIINQAINKVCKFNSKEFIKNPKFLNKYSNFTTVLPHSLLNYTLPEKFNKINYKSNYVSMEKLINHFKY
jgi:uncharacterized protein YktA (UPF0223 family)